MSRRGPLPDALRPLTWLSARMYGIGERVSARRMTAQPPRKLPVPVVSVGNITAGGTGKTPVTARIAEALIQSGCSPAIALRGYRADATSGSDEAAEYRLRFPDVPVLVGADRAGTAGALLDSDPTAFDILLLDDGFQHRRLHRDLDIVLVDATRHGLDGDLLPNGWLREPAGRLERADLVLVTNSTGESSDDPVAECIKRHRGSAPDAWSHHAWSALEVHRGDRAHPEVIRAAELPFRRVSIVSGLGNPAAFEAHVRREGFEVVSHYALRDHAAYDSGKLARIRRLSTGCEALVVPAKDWVKLRAAGPGILGDIPIIVPQVRVEFIRGQPLLEQALSSACGRAIAL